MYTKYITRLVYFEKNEQNLRELHNEESLFFEMMNETIHTPEYIIIEMSYGLINCKDKFEESECVLYDDRKNINSIYIDKDDFTNFKGVKVIEYICFKNHNKIEF